jgi:hypothetical protein
MIPTNVMTTKTTTPSEPIRIPAAIQSLAPRFDLPATLRT